MSSEWVVEVIARSAHPLIAIGQINRFHQPSLTAQPLAGVTPRATGTATPYYPRFGALHALQTLKKERGAIMLWWAS